MTTPHLHYFVRLPTSPLLAAHTLPSLIPHPSPPHKQSTAFPKDIAEAARAAAASGSVDAFAADLCTSWGAKENQGTREFRDVERAKIYPMMLNFARAAHVYGDMVGPLGQVRVK